MGAGRGQVTRQMGVQQSGLRSELPVGVEERASAARCASATCLGVIPSASVRISSARGTGPSGVSIDHPEALGVYRSEMSSHLWAATSFLGRAMPSWYILPSMSA